MNLDATRTSTVSEPRTAVTTTTYFTGFRDDAAFGAYGTDGRHRGCCCMYIYIDIDQNTNMKTRKKNRYCLVCARIYLHSVRVGLTFADRDTFKPPVISGSDAGTATILIPSTTRSAATDSAWIMYMLGPGLGFE